MRIRFVGDPLSTPTGEPVVPGGVGGGATSTPHALGCGSRLTVVGVPIPVGAAGASGPATSTSRAGSGVGTPGG